MVTAVLALSTRRATKAVQSANPELAALSTAAVEAQDAEAVDWPAKPTTSSVVNADADVMRLIAEAYANNANFRDAEHTK